MQAKLGWPRFKWQLHNWYFFTTQSPTRWGLRSMNQFKTRNRRSGPESIIQDKLVKLLRSLEWYVMETHGNAFQQGFPDIYATHKHYGPRWIEVKNPGSYSFTNAQCITFPLLAANGTQIWILVSDDETEYLKLFKPHNWESYFLKRMLG